jgi:hypothetical protein
LRSEAFEKAGARCSGSGQPHPALLLRRSKAPYVRPLARDRMRTLGPRPRLCQASWKLHRPGYRGVQAGRLIAARWSLGGVLAGAPGDGTHSAPSDGAGYRTGNPARYPGRYPSPRLSLLFSLQYFFSSLVSSCTLLPGAGDNHRFGTRYNTGARTSAVCALIPYGGRGRLLHGHPIPKPGLIRKRS